MKYCPKSLLAVSIISGTLMLSGCSSSSSSPSNTSNATISSKGVITGFGSVYVNGIKFETNSSGFSVDDQSDNDQSNLRVGMMVTIKGAVNADGTTGSASFIQYDNELKGPITNISAFNTTTLERTFTVLGKTITVNADTIYDDDADDLALTSATLANGNVIEVSGLTTASGITATHIEGQSATLAGYTGKIEMLGSVASLTGTDLTNIAFTINGFNIVTDASTVLDDLTLNDLADGVFIEVKGTLNGGGTRLTATKIEAKKVGLDDADEAEIKGVITEYNSTDKTFKVQGQMVDASNATLFPTTLALADGLTVEAEGSIVAGVLKASKVKQKGNKIKIEAAITAVDTTAGTITFNFNGTDVVVRVNAQTKMKDSVNNTQPFTLANINVGDFVKMKAFDDGTTTINAIKLELKTSDDIKIEGGITAFDATANTITLLGVNFDLSSAVFNTDSSSVSVDASFYSNISIGQFVKIKDNVASDGTIDEIELED